MSESDNILTEGIISRPGAKLLYRSASGLEKAMADVDGERLIGTDAEIIHDQWDPYAISYNNLPYLGYAMGVLLWEEGWSESTQREWVAKQFEYKSLRGTQAGIEMALHYTGRDFTGGYTIQQAIRPPQSFFASPSLSKEAYDFWIHLMPEIRITFYEGVGWDGVDVMFCDDGGCNWHVGLDDGEALHGRKAFIRIRGVDYPLQIYTFTKEINGVASIDYEQVSIPGNAGMAVMANDDFVNDDERFVCAEKVVPQLVTMRIDATYNHEESQLHLDTVVPGLDPIDVRYERESDIGWGNSFFFVGDWSDSRNLYTPEPEPSHPIYLPPPPPNTVPDPPPPVPIVYYADAGYDAGRMLADRIFLNDPAIAAVITGGISFVGVDYVSWPAYTADLMIDLHAEDEVFSWFADEGYSSDDNYFSSEVQLQDFDRSNRAVVTSQALRDRVRVAYDPTRLIELRERAWTETTVDQQVFNLL